MKDKRISEKEFGLNLNLDDSIKILSFGDSRYILNCWSGINREGSIGAVENEKGNYKVDFTLPSGVNTCIGSAQDQQNDAILFAIQNSGGNHGIYRYNIKEETVDTILVDPILNFNRSGKSGYIWSANVIDGLFTWCTGTAEAGKINIDGAKVWTDSGGSPSSSDHYQEINKQAITAIKAPPKYAPYMEYFTDPLRQTNFVTNKSFQFAFRYVYEDYEKSVFSPLSNTIYQPFDHTLADDLIRTARVIDFPSQELDVDTLFSNNQKSYNAINVAVRLGDRNVRYIEVAVRDSDLDAWNVFETVDNRLQLQGFSNPLDVYTIPFYNEKTGITVSDDAVLKSQDYFPINPKHQEFTHLNLMTYANFDDGYDLEDINASVTINNNIFDPYIVNAAKKSSAPAINVFLLSGGTLEWEAPTPSLLEEGDIIQFVGSSNSKVVPVAYYLVSDIDPLRTQFDFEDVLLKALQNQLIDAKVAAFQTSIGLTQTAGKRLLEINQVNGTFTQIASASIQEGKDFVRSTLKSGAYHQWAIVYYDEFGRHGPAQTSRTLKAYVPMWGETGQPNTNDSNAYYYTADIFINHQPPEWAHYYQLVYTGAIKIIDFIQFYHRAVEDDSGDGISGVTTWKDWIEHQEFHPRVSRNYSFEVGDFIREVKLGDFYNSFNTSKGAYQLSKLADDNRSSRVTKIGVDIGDSIDEISESPNSLGRIRDASAGANFGSRSLIEQFRYQQESEELIYKEVGLVFPIINPGQSNRFHGGNRDQSATQSARIDFNRGDAWTKLRPYESVTAVTGTDDTPSNWARETFKGRYYAPIVEDPEYSDYFPSSSKGFGRPFGENIDYKRTHETNGIRYTGTYLQGTKTNSLNSIDFENSGYVDVRHGVINGIKEIGYTLKVLQEHKVTSIYLGRQTTTNPQGTQDIILSDRVLSSFNPSELDYGCSHPESVVKHDRHLYFFDAAYGKVLRDSANGMELISDYKASSLFKKLGEDIQKVSKDFSFVRGCWNDETNSYVLTYMNHIPNPFYDDAIPPVGGEPRGNMDSFTISFQEIANKWKSFHSYIPEHMEFLGREFISFKEGGLWRHNSNDIRCNFYGVQYSAILTPVSNIEADKVKSFKAISLHSNVIPKLIEATIPPSDKIPEGMSTRVQGSNLRWIEGNLYGWLKKDLYTPGMDSDSEVKRLNNGREMRGNVCEFKITFDETGQVIVTRLIIELDHSLMSG